MRDRDQLSLGTRATNALAYNHLTLDATVSMTDRELYRLPYMGKHTVALLRALASRERMARGPAPTEVPYAFWLGKEAA